LLPQEPQVYLALAWNAGIMKGWEKIEVLENARKALALDPKLAQADAVAHLNKGMTEYLFDQSLLHAKLALKEFQAAIASDPKNTYGYFMTGCVCEEMDAYKLAAENFMKASELAAADDAPGREDARIFARTGNAFLRLADKANAKKYLQKAVDLDPDNEAARSLLASIDGN
jgi:tetratricopeptide (TPR) repeat protein